MNAIRNHYNRLAGKVNRKLEISSSVFEIMSVLYDYDRAPQASPTSWFDAMEDQLLSTWYWEVEVV